MKEHEKLQCKITAVALPLLLLSNNIFVIIAIAITHTLLIDYIERHND